MNLEVLPPCLPSCLPPRWVRCLLQFPHIVSCASLVTIHSTLYWSHLFKGSSSLWDCQLCGDGSHTWLVECRSDRTEFSAQSRRSHKWSFHSECMHAWPCFLFLERSLIKPRGCSAHASRLTQTEVREIPPGLGRHPLIWFQVSQVFHQCQHLLQRTIKLKLLLTCLPSFLKVYLERNHKKNLSDSFPKIHIDNKGIYLNNVLASHHINKPFMEIKLTENLFYLSTDFCWLCWFSL